MKRKFICSKCKKKILFDDIGSLGVYNSKQWFFCKPCTEIVDSYLCQERGSKALEDKNKREIEEWRRLHGKS
jgi:hypothetical protein